MHVVKHDTGGFHQQWIYLHVKNSVVNNAGIYHVSLIINACSSDKLFLRILCKLGRILQNLRLTLFDSTPLLLSIWTLPNNCSTGLYMTLPSSTCIQYSMSVEHLEQSTCTQSCNVKIFGYRYIHLIAEGGLWINFTSSLTTRVHA